MMKKNLIHLLFTAAIVFALSYGCKKIDVPNTNTVEVTLTSKGPAYLTENVTLNPGAAFSLNFTITCPTDMEYVYVSKNGTIISTDQLSSDKRSFTADKTFAADVAAGVYTYRIWARDKAGVYLGEHNVVVSVTSDFTYYTVKTIVVPDTAKNSPTYYATTTNEFFSYNNVGNKSNLIDFGYFYDPTLTGTVPNGHTIYALNINPVPAPIAMYDLSNFTKNATVFKLITTPAFATGLVSGASLAALGTTLNSGTSTSIKGLKTGNMVAFRTAAGKIGVILVNYTNQDQPWKSTFMSFDIKMQN